MSARCLYGGPAPCIDDLCHGAHVTLCGVDLDFERELGAADGCEVQEFACDTCGGDGLIVVGWDAAAYENVEGPCPDCAAYAGQEPGSG